MEKVSQKKVSEAGFSIIETLLIVVIVGIIGGTGAYLYHTNKAANKDLNSTASTTAAQQKNSNTKNTAAASSKTAPQAARYLTISEWGVHLPYASANTDTYSYTIDNGEQNPDASLATVASTHLQTIDSSCQYEGAGQIFRATGSTPVTTGSSETIAQAAAKDPTDYRHVGNYYYRFDHDQAACGNTVTVDQQNQANDAVKAMVMHIQAYPASSN